VIKYFIFVVLEISRLIFLEYINLNKNLSIKFIIFENQYIMNEKLFIIMTSISEKSRLWLFTSINVDNWYNNLKEITI